GLTASASTRQDTGSYTLHAAGHQVAAQGGPVLQTDSYALAQEGLGTFAYREEVAKTAVRPDVLGELALGVLSTTTAASLAGGLQLPDGPLVRVHQQSLTLTDSGTECYSLRQDGAGDGATRSWDHEALDSYQISSGDRTSADNGGAVTVGWADAT